MLKPAVTSMPINLRLGGSSPSTSCKDIDLLFLSNHWLALLLLGLERPNPMLIRDIRTALSSEFQ
jgi:hypothetical protein